MKNPVLKRIAGPPEPADEGMLQRALRRFRLPLRERSDLAQAAALNRAERLFEVNFRSKWTR